MVFVYAALGLVILLLAGDALVKGAVNLSLRMGIPALILLICIVHSCILLITLVKDTVNNLLASYARHSCETGDI